MLIANKVDVKDRQVSLEEGQKLAMKHRCSYSEVSAENDKDGVTSIFYKLSQEVLDAQGLRNDRSPLRIRRFFSVFNPRIIKQRRRMKNFWTMDYLGYSAAGRLNISQRPACRIILCRTKECIYHVNSFVYRMYHTNLC